MVDSTSEYDSYDSWSVRSMAGLAMVENSKAKCGIATEYEKEQQSNGQQSSRLENGLEYNHTSFTGVSHQHRI